MKKKLSLILAIVMMISIIAPLIASAEEGVEKYIPNIKKMFDIGDEYGEFNLHTHTRRGDTTYDMNWTDESNNYNISVEIDVDGNILRYNKYKMNNRQEHSKFPKISKEEALKTAKEMISKVDPTLLQNTKYEDEDIMGDLNRYYFRFQRTKNDIPFMYNSISVQVDNSTGEINNLSIDWDRDSKLPNNDNIIDGEEAFDLYKEGQDLELIYRLNNEDDKLEGKLLYTFKDKTRAIDAKTGKAVKNLNSMNEYIYYGFLFGQMEQVSIEDANKLINEKEIVSRETAKKSLRKFANLDESYELQGSSLKKSKLNDSYVWDLQMNMQKGNRGYGTTVSVDAKTGEVLNFHKFNINEEAQETKYTEDEAMEIAKEFLKDNMKDKYSKVENTESSINLFGSDERAYSFKFIREEDGIKVPQNGFSLSINAVTGELMDYNYMWNDIEIPSIEKIIGAKEAEEILLAESKLELNYIIDKDSVSKDKKEIKLVYNLDSEQSIFVDAMTGELISPEDLYRNPMNKKDKEYKDIEESYAKDEIKKLKEYGIYLPGENFNPKEDIIQKDFLYLLKNTKGYISPYNEEYIYERFGMEGVIKSGEKAPNKAITRGEAIKYLVRSFDQERAANLEGVYNSNYDDIDTVDKDLKGYIAVAEGLGVISGKGNFRANDNLTREEAAMIIYNILDRD